MERKTFSDAEQAVDKIGPTPIKGLQHRRHIWLGRWLHQLCCYRSDRAKYPIGAEKGQHRSTTLDDDRGDGMALLCRLAAKRSYGSGNEREKSPPVCMVTGSIAGFRPLHPYGPHDHDVPDAALVLDRAKVRH